MSRGSVSIDVRTEVLIDIRWTISVDGRVFSVDGGERVLVKKTGVWVDGISIDTLVAMSIDYSIGISIDAFGQALMRRLNMLTKLPRSAFALL
ncbi:hypothetical protein F2Q70_00038413 [Brassica cretica]|uniref:Uncharacterized protein n=1 Tax=Brassica cretica TaxID=69181 RepID=A0A8S9K2H5_BRACR|nr:hypothetical protein F2Q70_00038413 [Brassica cretica]